MKTDNKALKGLEWGVKILISLSLIAMILLVFLNAILRYAFNSGITEAEELARYFFVWTVFLGAALAYKNNLHVGVDLVVERLKGTSKKIIVTVGDLATLFAVAVVLLGSAKFMETVAGTKSPATGLPVSLLAVSLVISSLVIGTIVIGRLFQRWIKKEEV